MFSIYGIHDPSERRVIATGFSSREAAMRHVSQMEGLGDWPEGFDAIVENDDTGEMWLEVEDEEWSRYDV